MSLILRREDEDEDRMGGMGGISDMMGGLNRHKSGGGGWSRGMGGMGGMGRMGTGFPFWVIWSDELLNIYSHSYEFLIE